MITFDRDRLLANLAASRAARRRPVQVAGSRRLADWPAIRPPRRTRVQREPGWYYVTVRDDARVAVLAGPFRYHRQALRFLRQAREAAVAVDWRAHFYAFGTARWPNGDRPGVLNEQLGLVARGMNRGAKLDGRTTN